MYDQNLHNASVSRPATGPRNMSSIPTVADNRMASHSNGNQRQNINPPGLPRAVAPPQQQHQQLQAAIPLAAPRPGYPAPIAALNLSRSPSSPVPAHPQPAMSQGTPLITQGRQPAIQRPQVPPALRINRSNEEVGAPPRVPPAIYMPGSPAVSAPPSVPSTPHPLQPPMTPITPVFARPSISSPAPSDVKFSSDILIRGDSEDALLRPRGEKGDDFWRRFSMVAKEPESQQTSLWLKKTQNGTSRLSRWVWFVGVILLLCIAGGIAIGWYFTHNSTSETTPEVIGGGADESMTSSVPSSTTGTSLYVSPTNTVARRTADAFRTTTLDLEDIYSLTPESARDVIIPPRDLRQTSRNLTKHSRKHLARSSHA